MITKLGLDGNSTSYPLVDLLVTKLKPPAMRSKLVQRVRLTNRVRTGMHSRLTMVVAPAGYGKSTLLRTWLMAVEPAQWPVAWVTLDAYDNDPARFWSYIVSALLTIHPDLHFDVLRNLRKICNANDCVALDPLLNEIASIPEQFSLVIDDYHVIHTKFIHQTLNYLIDHMPENMHLVVASRTEPPLALSRWRARGQLVEIQSSDLSFTLDETITFLRYVMDLDIEIGDIATLVRLTEGWIAGLQLAAISITRQRDVHGFVADFARSQRHILEYLTDEVLNQQSEAIKEFLIKTSILAKMSGPLCDAMLERTGSQEILKYLEQANLFIQPLDENQHNWFRYHALFADLLKTYLRDTYPKMIPQLHLAACCWLNQNGYPEDAVPHALAAGEAELAANIVESCALKSIIRFDLATVMQWINLLPETEYIKRPKLGIYFALANLMAGNLGDIEMQLHEIEHNLEQLIQNGFATENTPRLQRQIDAIRVAAACMRGDFEQGVFLSLQTIENLDYEDYFFLGLIEHHLGCAYETSGQLSEAVAALGRACQNATRHNMPREFVVSQCARARFYKLQGRMDTAAKAYQQALDIALEQKLDRYYRIYPQVGLSEILSERNELTQANELVVDALDQFLLIKTGELDWYYSIDISLGLAKNRLLHHDLEAAADYLRFASLLVQTYNYNPYLVAVVREVQVRLWLAQGDFRSARNWAEKVEKQLDDPSNKLFEIRRAALARTFLALGRPEKASRILTTLLADLRGSERGELILAVQVLYALALGETGAQKEAVAMIKEAAGRAEPQGYVRIFIDEGDKMKALLSEARSLSRRKSTSGTDAPSLGYLEKLLRSFESDAKTELNPITRRTSELGIISPVAEPLSDREIQVLNLLADGLSTSEVAKALVISVNTAKAHVKNIYQKLDVHSRKEVLERALELNLLSDQMG